MTIKFGDLAQRVTDALCSDELESAGMAAGIAMGIYIARNNPEWADTYMGDLPSVLAVGACDAADLTMEQCPVTKP